MKITKRSLKSVADLRTLLVNYPNALDELETTLKDKSFKAILDIADESFKKEINEHNAARINTKDVKVRIRALSKSLRTYAYQMEDAVNLLLELQGSEERIDYKRTKNNLQDFENLLNDIEKYADLVKANSLIEKTYQKFKKDLDDFRTTSSDIGEAVNDLIDQKDDVNQVIKKYHPVVSFIVSGIKEYLRIAKPEVYNEYKKLYHKKQETKQTTPTHSPLQTKIINLLKQQKDNTGTTQANANHQLNQLPKNEVNTLNNLALTWKTKHGNLKNWNGQ